MPKHSYSTSGELSKVAISSGLARKVFDRAYSSAELAKNFAKTHANPSELVSSKVNLPKAKQLVQGNFKKAEKASSKEDWAGNMLDKRISWEKNKATYGIRNPSLVDKAKHFVSSKMKSKSHNPGLSQLQPEYAYA